MASRAFCGIVHKAQDGHLVHLPLEELRVKVLIVDVSARVSLTQVYSNSSTDRTARAKYVFPIPARAAVCAFQMNTEDGRTIRGVCKESKQAAEEHEKAVQQGKLTSLVEWATDDIFTISLGSLPPQQKVTVRITFVLDLMNDDEPDRLRFQLPMIVGERYGKLPSTMEGAASPTGSAVVKMKIHIQTRGEIKDIVSPTHPQINVQAYLNHHGEPSRHRSIVRFISDEFLQEDFVLSVGAHGLDEPRCFVERDPITGSTALQLTLIPKFELPPVETQEYLFVIDRSGSMSGNCIETAKETLVALLHTLPAEGTAFNIVSFGSHSSKWRPTSVQYSQETMVEATSHVESMSADFGGTEIRSALSDTFNARSRFIPTAVFVLTDGRAHNVDDTIAVVTTAVSNATPDAPLRVFTLGIGTTVSTAMCEGIARAGNGVCLMASGSEDILSKTSKLVGAGRTFILRNVSIDWGLPPDVISQHESRVESAGVRFSEHDEIFRQAPAKIETLYPSVRLVVFALIRDRHYRVPDEIVLRGQRDGEGEMVEFRIPVDLVKFANVEPHIPFVHVLCARRIIRDIEDRKPGNGILSEEQIKAGITKLGLHYQLASRHTSFIAVEGTHTEPTTPRQHKAHHRHREDMSSILVSTAVTVGSWIQWSLDFTATFVPIFASTWFGPPPPNPSPQSDSPPPTDPDHTVFQGLPGARPQSRASTIDTKGHPVENDEANPDDPGYSSDNTYSTMSSLESYSSSDSDYDDLESERGRAGASPADDTTQRSPSPDFHRAAAPQVMPGTIPLSSNSRARGRLGTAGPSSRSQTAPSSTESTKTIFNLISLQAFDGSFTLNDDLGKIVGESALKVGQEIGVDATIWATALAIAYLRKHLTNQRELLEGFEQKALKFVDKSVLAAGLHFSAVLERAKMLVA
ncbi:von Willebrand factor type A domain-containing protein [Abortiporus biennis]|nr:von Willebrand factor type A domain-containing protein [Abortiporus biennis]